MAKARYQARKTTCIRSLPSTPLYDIAMRIVIPGGTGHVGRILEKHFVDLGHDVVILSRTPKPGGGELAWDGKTLGDWTLAIEGAEVVINLAGRTVNCRYTTENQREMMDSRIDSTRVVGQAIAGADHPPRLWLQASTATIYAHRFDAPNDEATGILGGKEPNVPPKWWASVGIAKSWEKELEAARTPNTRKVALRSAMTMSPDPGGIFDVMATLARRGLGGTAGTGRQYVSWIQEMDFVRAIDFLIEREDLSGPVNVSSPHPLPNGDFFRTLRQAVGAPFGLPTPAWMLEIGAWAMGTETELLLKSRRVIPTRLLESGFRFEYPEWPGAAQELAKRWRERH